MFNFSLKAKLVLSALLAAIMLVLCGGAGLYALSAVEENYKHIGKVNNENIRVTRALLSEVRRATEVVGTYAVSSFENTAAFDILSEEITDLKKKIDAHIIAKEKIESTAEQKKIFAAFINEYQKYTQELENYRTLARSAETAKSKANVISFLNGEFQYADDELHTQLKLLIDSQLEDERVWIAQANRTSEQANQFLPLAVLIFFIVLLSISLWVATSVANQIKSISYKLVAQAADLTGASINVAAASTELSTGITEQAAALQETASAVDEINAVIIKNVDSSKRSETLATTSFDNAARGQAAVGSMISSINSINEGTNEIMAEVTRSNKKISEIVEVIAEIGTKTKVINDIVFQTKLLSFNASVEAARAGEHGKGFTVVAKEVGDLARMSGVASDEISVLLDDSIQKVQNIVNETKNNIEALVGKSKAKVDSGIEIAQQGADILSQIVTNVSTVRNVVSEIAVASDEQAHGISEIAKAISQLDLVTQQNSRATHQTSVASEQLRAQSEDLKELINGLVMIISGKTGSSSSEGSYSNKKVVNYLRDNSEKYKKNKVKSNSINNDTQKAAATDPRHTPQNSSYTKIAGEVPASDSPGFTEN